VKQEGWQLQRTRDRPCQSAHFVDRPAGFDGSLFRQPENSVPDNFNREWRFLQNETEEIHHPHCLSSFSIYTILLPFAAYSILQVSVPTPTCRSYK